MFFVLNTGRAGSKTIAKVLSQAPDCECLHEPEPCLIEEASKYRYGTYDVDSIVDTLRRTRVDSQRAGTYGESNNRLALIVPVLERAFPGSRYLWLVRDGRDFVASVHQRGWFADREYSADAGPWSRWRLQGDLVGDVDPTEWSNWSSFERCCWIWEYTNRLIRHDLDAVGQDRWLLVRIEKLAVSVHGICDFLDITPTRFVVNRANRRTTDDSYEGTTNSVSTVATWHEWTSEQRNVFARRCGALMDELYPEWRSGDSWHGTSQEVEGRATLVTDREHRQVTSDEIPSIRADLAELKLQRGDLRALTRLLTAAEQRTGRQAEMLMAGLDELRKAVTENDAVRGLRDDLAIARTRAERAEQAAAELRRSLEQTRKELTTASERSRALLADRDKYQRAIRERDAERSRANALANSTSYRFGHGVVMLVKHPIRTPLRVAKRVWRRLRSQGGQSTHPTAAASGITGGGVTSGPAKPSRAGAGVPGSAPPAGSRTPPPHTPKPLLSDRHPIHAYVALGFGEDQLRKLARAVRQSAMVSGGHVPLIVTDSPSFSLIRDTGVAVEYIPDREMWETHSDKVGGWDEFRSSRITHLLSIHQPTRTIVLNAADAVELRQMLDLSLDSP